MNKRFGYDGDREGIHLGTDVTKIGRSEISKTLNISHVEDLLRIARRKSEVDDEKAIPALKEGQALFKAERYEEALQKYIYASQLGHLRAQRRLGVMYLEGIGCVQDYQSALEWLEIASKQNDLHAQEHLARIYRQGLGIKANIETAIGWYLIAKDSGGIKSTFELATCYDDGDGVPQNTEKALQFYMIAADRGHAEARYRVGLALEKGIGGKQNVQEAIDWYILAIKGGNDDARVRFWALVDEGEFVPESSEEAEFAEKIGFSLNDPICKIKQAIRQITDYDEEPDEKHIEEILSKVKYNDWSNSLENNRNYFGSTSYKAHWLLEDDFKSVSKWAFHFYSKCLEGNHSEFDFWKNNDYSWHEGYKQDVESTIISFKNFETSDLINFPSIYYIIGLICLEKFGKDYVKIMVNLLERAAKLECKYSMLHLAICYKYGVGVEENYERYHEYLVRSANLEHPLAMYCLSSEFTDDWLIDDNSKSIDYPLDPNRRPENCTVEEASKYQELWLRKASDAGHTVANKELAQRKWSDLKEKTENRLQLDIRKWAEWGVLKVEQDYLANVDENIVLEVVKVYVNEARNGNIDALWSLMEIDASERIRTIGVRTRDFLVSQIKKIFENEKNNLNYLLELDKKFFHYSIDEDEYNYYDCADCYDLKFLFEKLNYEKANLKIWNEKLNNYIIQCLDSIFSDNPIDSKILNDYIIKIYVSYFESLKNSLVGYNFGIDHDEECEDVTVYFMGKYVKACFGFTEDNKVHRYIREQLDAQNNPRRSVEILKQELVRRRRLEKKQSREKDVGDIWYD